jgi:hypothetical protein
LFRFHYVGYESQYPIALSWLRFWGDFTRPAGAGYNPIALSGLVLFKTNTEISSMNSILKNFYISVE